MGRLGIFLLVLFLAVAVNARRSGLRQPRINRLPLPKACENIQSFERGHKYIYNYDAIVESENHDTTSAVSGMRIKCDEIEIRIPVSCTASMTVSRCSVFEGVLQPDGSLSYATAASPASIQLEKALRRNPIYFHFNKGLIVKIFLDNSDTSDIANIKRGILSALQLEFDGSGLRTPLRAPVEWPEVNIFGVGNGKRVVTAYQDGYARDVQVARDINRHNLPWSRKQWSSFHTSYDGLEITKLISDMFVEHSKTLSGEARQSCDYTLERGRHVTETTCVELRQNSLFNNSSLQSLIESVRGDNILANSKITLNIKQLTDTRMIANDRISRNEIARFRKYYQEESIMFEEQWQETMDGSFTTFNPVVVLHDLVAEPENRSTSALFAKLARYIAKSTEHEINSIWATFASRHSGHKMEKASNIWIQLLHGCSSATYWCPLPQCEPSLACQEALGSFISSTGLPSWTPNVERGVLNALSSIPKPNITVVRSALSICRAKTTPLTVVTLGKVLASYVTYAEMENEERSFVQAREFLADLLNNDCTIPSTRGAVTEEVMLAAMKGISALAEEGEYAVNQVVACARNPRASKSLALNAIRSLKNIPIEDNVRAQVLAIYSDAERPIALRLACYLLIIVNEPSRPELRAIADVATRESEPRALRFYIKEHVKSQLTLRDTSFCELSDSTVRGLMSIAESTNWDVDVSSGSTVVEKNYNVTRPIFVPYLNREVNCTFASNLVYARNSLIPMLANVTVSAELINRNIKVLETTLDLGGILSVLEPLFGNEGIFPTHGLEQLLQTPLSQLWQPTIRDLPLLPNDEKIRLGKMQDEGSMAYSMLMMQNKSPVQMKLLNMPVDFWSVFKLSSMRNMNLMNMWKMLDTLETGLNFEGVLADQPLLAHIASPTSIGSPHIFHLDASYYHHIHARAVAEVKKIFLTGRGEISLESKPITKMSLVWVHKIQLPNGLSCGSGYQLSAGHSSDLNAEMIATAKKIQINVSPLPASTELISLKVDEVVVKQGVHEIVEQTQICSPICLLGNCRSGTSLLAKNCFRPILDIGLFIESDARNHYEIVANWGRKETIVNGANLPSRGLEFKLNTKDSRTSEPVTSIQIAAKYIPALNEVRCEVGYGNQLQWVVGANVALYHTPSIDNNPMFDGMIASFNVTKSSGVSLTNILKIQRQQNEEPMLMEVFDFLTGHEASVSQPTYSVNAGLQLPVIGEYSATGVVLLNQQVGGYSARIRMKEGPMGSENGRSICIWNISSSVLSENNMQGFLTEASVEDMNINIFPYTNLSLALKVMNDSVGNGYQVISCKAHQRYYNNPHFFHTRLDMMKAPNTASDAIVPYTLKSTSTMNIGQLQFDIVANNTSHLDTRHRFILPKTMISHSRINYNTHEQLRISSDDYLLQPDVYSLHMCAAESAGGEISVKVHANKTTTPYSSLMQLEPHVVSYKAEMILRPSQCSRCHYFNVDLPSLRILSHYERAEGHEGHQFLMNAHEAMLQYLPITMKAKDKIRWYSKSPLNDRLKIGYTYKANWTDDDVFCEIGYHFADKVFNAQVVLKNLNFYRTSSTANFLLNLTCDKCLPFYDSIFNSTIAIDYSEDIPATFAGIATKGQHVLADISLMGAGSHNFKFRTGYHLLEEKNKLIDLVWSVDVGYMTAKSNWRSIDDHLYRSEMNITRLNLAERKTTEQEDYRIASRIGFLPRSPVFIGNWSTIPVDYRSYPDLCEAGRTCYRSTIDGSQVTECGNFVSFYESKGQKPEYVSTNCVSFTYNSISSGRACNTSMWIDGRRNAELPVNTIRIGGSKDLHGNSEGMLGLDLSRPFSFIPANMNLTVKASAQPTHKSGVSLSTDVGLVEWWRDSSEVTFNVATQTIPLEIGCNGRFDLSNPSRISFDVPQCRFGNTLLIPSGPVTIAAQGMYESWTTNNIRVVVERESNQLTRFTWNNEDGRLATNILCGAETDPNSPCNIQVTIRRNSIDLNARITSKAFNHTHVMSYSKLSDTTSMRDSNFNMVASTSVVYGSIPIAWDAMMRYSMENGWYVNTSLNSTESLTNALLINNGKIESLYMVGQSIEMLWLPEALGWKVRFSSQPSAVMFYTTTAYGRNMNYTMGWYSGDNNPIHSFAYPSESRNHGLRTALWNFTSCSTNLMFKVKVLTSSTDNSILHAETGFKTNIWPNANANWWNPMIALIMPSYVWLPIRIGELEWMVNYDTTRDLLLDARMIMDKINEVTMSYATPNPMNHRLRLSCSRSSWPIVSLTIARDGSSYDVGLLCGSENDPSSPCNIRVSMDRSAINLDTRINSVMYNHTATVYFSIPAAWDLISMRAMTWDLATTNSIMYRTVPIVYDSTIRRSSLGWYVNTSLNSTNWLTNSLLINNGRLESLYMVGKSIYLPTVAIPYSWFFTFSSNAMMDIDMYANASLGNEAIFSTGIFTGINHPRNHLYLQSVDENAYIQATFFNFTTCSKRAIFSSKNLFASRSGALTKMETIASINTWPFVRVTPWTWIFTPLLPQYWTCPFCVGELELTSSFDASMNNQAILQMVMGKRTQLIMNYTMTGNKAAGTYHLSGTTDVNFDIDRTTSAPHIALRNLLNVIPGELYELEWQSLAERFPTWNFHVNETYRYRPGQVFNNHLTIASERLSMLSSLESSNEMTRIVFRWPNKPDAPISIDVAMTADQVELHDLTIYMPMMMLHINRAVVALIRNDLHHVIGFNMNDLSATATTWPAHNEMSIVGHANVEIGGVWNINIHDTESKFMNIMLMMRPGPTITSSSNILLHLPMMEFDWMGHTAWSAENMINNYTLSMSWMHMRSHKMMPLLHMQFSNNRRTYGQDTTETLDASMDLWNMWMPTMHWSPSLHVSRLPTADGSAQNVDFLLKFWKKNRIATTATISKTCSWNMPLYNGLTICIPESANLSMLANLPTWTSEMTAQYGSGHWLVNSNFTMMMWDRATAKMVPLADLRHQVNMTIMQDSMNWVGACNMSYDLTWPMPMNWETDVIMSPTPDNSATTMDVILHWGMLPMATFTIGAPTTAGLRHFTLTAMDMQMLSANWELTGCALSLPIYEDLTWCIPSQLEISNMNTNIPVTRILRLIPLFSATIPENDLFDINLHDSTVAMHLTKQGATWTMASTMHLFGPHLPEGLEVDTLLSLGPETITWRMDMNKWDWTWHMTFVPTSMALTFESSMASEWMVTDFRLVCPGMMQIDQAILKMKTLGTLHDWMPMDVDYEYRCNRRMNTWSVNLRSFAISAIPLMEGNVSLSVDNTMMNIFVRWDIMSESHPLWNQIFEVKLNNPMNTNMWNCYSVFSNIFFWMEMSTSVEDWQFMLKNLTLGLPDSTKGVNIMYIPADTEPRKVVMLWQDTPEITYICEETLYIAPASWRLACKRLQARGAHTPASETLVATTVWDWTYSSWFSVWRNALFFNYTNLMDENWINNHLATKLHMNDAQLRLRISGYISKEVSTLLQRFTAALYPDPNNYLMSYLYYEHPSPSYYAWSMQYVDSMMQIARRFTNNVVTMKIVNGTDYIALQCNVTLPGWTWNLMQTELWMSVIDDIPLANWTMITPFATQYIVFETGLTVRPVMIAYKAMGSPNEIRMNLDIQEAGLVSFITNITLPNGNRFMCRARRPNPTIPALHCTCYKLEGDAIGSQVASFDIPKPTLRSLAMTIYEALKNIMSGSMNSYMQEKLHIVDVRLMKDVEQMMSRTTNAVAKMYKKLWPKSSLYKKLKALLDELVPTLGLELTSYIEDEHYSMDYSTLMHTVYDSLTSIVGDEEFRIPILSIHWPIASAELFMELGMELPRKIGVVLDVNSLKMPNINQEIRTEFWYNEERNAMCKLSMNNAWFWSVDLWNLSTMTYMQSSMGLPGSTNSVDITTVLSPTGSITGINVNFLDTEGSAYTCHMTRSTGRNVHTTCVVHTNAADSEPVCEFDLPLWSLTATEFLTQSTFFIPEVYMAAVNPLLFKHYLRTTFHFTNDHALNVISAYLTEQSRNFLDRFHNDYIDNYINKMLGKSVTSYNEAMASTILIKFIAVPQLDEVLRGRLSVLDALEDVVSDIMNEVVRELIYTWRKAFETYREITHMLSQIVPSYRLSRIPAYLPSYSLRDVITASYVVPMEIQQLQYVWQRTVCYPNEIPLVFAEFYNKYHIIDYLMSYFSMRGATYRWFVPSGEYNRMQVISYRGQYYELPIPANCKTNQCVYVHATDPITNSFNILSRGDTLLIAMYDNMLEIHTNRSVFVATPDGERNEVELPYVTDEAMCQMLGDEIYCNLMNLEARLLFPDGVRTHASVTLRFSEFALGIMGAYSHLPTPALLLPDGIEAVNPAQMMNAYELTRKSECRLSEQNTIPRSNAGHQHCQEAFASPQMLEASRHNPSMAAYFTEACSSGCSGISALETCVYTNAFVKQLRVTGYPASENMECLNCNINDMSTAMESGEAYILVSLSEDSSESQAKKSLRKAITKTVARLRKQGLSDAKVGIVTYGGDKSLYSPMMTSINGLSTSNNVDLLMEIIKVAEFNGPTYDPSSTVDALKFVARTLKTAPLGVAKCLVVFAPETETNNCARVNMDKLIQEFNHDMTSVLWWSTLTNEQCTADGMDIVLGTQGSCIDVSSGTSREVADAVVDNLIGKIGSNVQCSCDVSNPYTGHVDSKCDVSSDLDITY